MVRFLQLQFRMGKIDEEYLTNLVESGRITEEQKLEIMGVE